jgi:hypothetical protein
MAFLDEFHEDIRLLVNRLDGLFSERGWEVPVDRGSRVTGGLNVSLTSKWIIQHVSRFYTPRQSPALRPMVLFSARLNSTRFEEPMCLVAVGHFQPTMTASSIWERWNDTTAVLSYLADHPGRQALTPMLLSQFMPDAKHVEAFVVPLTDLRDDQALETLVVRPALEMAIVTDSESGGSSDRKEA